MSFKLSPELIAAQIFPATAGDFRAAVEKERAARDQTRRRDLEAQTSASSSAYDRIRIWEQLHALRLPKNSDHKLIAVIAEQTHLTVAQILTEQQRRAGAERARVAG